MIRGQNMVWVNEQRAESTTSFFCLCPLDASGPGYDVIFPSNGPWELPEPVNLKRT